MGLQLFQLEPYMKSLFKLLKARGVISNDEYIEIINSMATGNDISETVKVLDKITQ